MSAALQVALLVGAFTLAGATAELAGAENLGTALSFGQIAFALVLIALLVRR